MSDLLEKILDKRNMNEAYKKACANKGAGGVDGMGLEKLGGYIREKCFQNPLDNKNHLFALYFQCPYLPHPFTVIYVIEKAFDIKLNHIVKIHALKHGASSLHSVFNG